MQMEGRTTYVRAGSYGRYELAICSFVLRSFLELNLVCFRCLRGRGGSIVGLDLRGQASLAEMMDMLADIIEGN